MQGTADSTPRGVQPSPLSAQASELKRAIRRNRSVRMSSSALFTQDLSLKVGSALVPSAEVVASGTGSYAPFHTS